MAFMKAAADHEEELEKGLGCSECDSSVVSPFSVLTWPEYQDVKSEKP